MPAFPAPTRRRSDCRRAARPSRRRRASATRATSIATDSWPRQARGRTSRRWRRPPSWCARCGRSATSCGESSSRADLAIPHSIDGIRVLVRGRRGGSRRRFAHHARGTSVPTPGACDCRLAPTGDKSPCRITRSVGHACGVHGPEAAAAPASSAETLSGWDEVPMVQPGPRSTGLGSGEFSA